MRRIVSLKTLTITENINATLVGLGTFFYTQSILGFGDRENLWLGLGIGIAIMLGALLSHPLSIRLGERRQVNWILILSMLVHGVMGALPHVWIIVGGAIAVNFLNGLKWPVMESYITAGLTQAQTSKALGWFNIYWSAMVVVGLVCAGPMIRFSPPGLFYLAMTLNVVSLCFTHRLEARLVHLAADHPDRPDETKMQQLGELLVASRWGLVLGLVLSSIVNPLLPGIFARMGYTVIWATTLASAVHFGRWSMFVIMEKYKGWHDKSWPITMMLGSLPICFFMVLAEHDVVSVVLGGLLFGMLESVAYYTALYYAMVVKNAAVDAGGHHEAIIGAGSSSGPIAALAGQGLGTLLGSATLGLILGIGPVAVGMVGAGLWPIYRRKWRGR